MDHQLADLIVTRLNSPDPAGFDDWLVARSFDRDTLTTAGRACLLTQFHAEQAPGPGDETAYGALIRRIAAGETFEPELMSTVLAEAGVSHERFDADLREARGW